MEERFSVAAEKATVYGFLTDPEKVTRCMPDVREVEIHDPDHFTVKARVGVSHIKGTMTMKLAITERQPPDSTTVVGKGSGLASTVDMVTSFTLDPTGDGATVVNWRGEVNVAGKLAAFASQGLLDRIGRANVDRFVEGVKLGIQALGTAGPPAA